MRIAMKIAIALALVSVFVSPAGRVSIAVEVARNAVAAGEIGFNQHVRPLLTESCFTCHGPDSAGRKADLRLDLRESAIESGAIIPGDAEQSELIARITSSDPDLVMPPPDSRKQLSDADKLLLQRWVAAGAKYEVHWSFIRPERVAPPPVKDSARWARNPLDQFVLAELNEHSLTPNDDADPYTLARRLALDLTGLPPEQQLLETFIDQGDRGYSQYVDSLLSLPQAGEHRARYWLDAARYGDTHGMHVDNYREIWPYRDWVIRAFNTNMPFDQFVVEQIAGDLLPDAGLDQQIATGFNRCNITTSEGGAISDEVNVRYMVDRVETTATVFLGLTAGCAVCHDHKYDPISQREFYQLGAFFNNTTQPAMDGNQRDTPPVVTLPKDEFADEWKELIAKRAELRRELTQRTRSAAAAWSSRSQQHEHPVASDELLLWMPLHQDAGDTVPLAEGASWATDHPAGQRGMRFGERSKLNAEVPALRTDEPLTISFWYRTPDRVMDTTLFEQTERIKVPSTQDGNDDKTEEDKTEEAAKEITVGWKINNGVRSELTFEMFDRNGNRLRALLPDNEALQPRTWQHVCIRYSGGQSQSSVTISVNGRSVAIRHGSEALIDATELASAPLVIGKGIPTASLSDIRLYRRWINDEELRLLSEDYLLRRLLRSNAEWSSLTSDEQARYERFFAEVVDEGHRSLAAKLSTTQRRRDYIYARSTTTLVMQERDESPRAWVLQRGEYDQRQEQVSPGVPAVLPPLGVAADANRLDLAHWLVRPDHPLTARVMVNRLWQSLFGTGLVKTSEDFGVMGDRPSHPQLLDWLAVEFVESGWDVQHILKLITSSSAYRQSAVTTREKLAADPQNRLLARGPRLRLDAEVLRDQALAVSGLLRRDLGGPSVRPYQPAGLWKVVAITGSNTAEFKQDSGEALYRRSFYTFWKRTSPPPSMAAFNAPTREQCTVRRERTNTPLQALVLMNDPQYVEAARRLAERALLRDEEADERVSWLLRTALGRPPNSADVDELVSASRDFRESLRDRAVVARDLVHTGESTPDDALDVMELAVWTLVANTIMNRDDFINK